LRDRGFEGPEESIDLLRGVVFTDRDPDDRKRVPLRAAHGEKYWRSLVPAGGAGRPAPDGITERIEEEHEALGLDAGNG
jgi:hypothetical protein